MKAFLNFVLAAMMILQTGFLSMNPAAAQGEVTETPTPTQGPMEPAVGTSTPTPSETPSPTATETVQPSPTPTTLATETAPVVVTEEIILSLYSDLAYLQRGRELYIEWSIGGMKEIGTGSILRFYLPKGLTLIDPGIGKLNEAGDMLDIEVTEFIGKVGFMAGEEVESPLVIRAELLLDGKSLAKAGVSLMEPNETLVGSKGGTAAGLAGKVKVIFREGVLSEKVIVRIGKPTQKSLPVDSLSGSPFEITAVSETAKAEVSQLPGEVEIQVKYDETELGGDEDDLRLFWYDPTDGQWKLPLRQYVDIENNILHAYTDHFTVFDTYNSGWQSAETPTLDLFQQAGTTGAASFSLPIKVPPGPGGFQPSLTLSYNSQVVDSASTDTQASWVGMGWSLDAGAYIERNGFGTKDESDDSYSLTLQGMGGALWLGTDGRYHLENENFAKITYNETTDVWTVLDKVGNQYYFEESAGYERIVDCPGQSQVVEVLTWRWMLKRAVNIYGQQITYNYAREYDTATTVQEGCSIVHYMTHYIYPDTIEYANGRYRVKFNRVARHDYKPEWLTLYASGAYKTFQRSRLSSIEVQQDADENGSFETLIRKYTFTFCAEQSCSIFPAYVWPSLQNYRTPTLTAVREYGLGGTSSLPAYTFEYGDGMHLTGASNGRGGSVTYAYYTWNESIPVENWADGMLETAIPRWGNPLKCHFQDSKCDWEAVEGQGIVGGGINGYLRVYGLAQKLVQSYQPGRWYRIVAGVKAPIGTPTLQLGYSHKVNGVLQADVFFPEVTLNGTLKTIESDVFFLPRDTTYFAPRLNTSGNSDLYWYYLMPMPTYARVSSRILTAGGNTYTFQYDYLNPAMNTTANSAAAATDHPYTPVYTEFRGYEYVTESDPDGKQVITRYGQGDCNSGRALSVTTSGDGVTTQSDSTTHTCTQYVPATIPVDTEWPSANTSFTGIKYRWVRTASETKSAYGGTPNEVVATLTTTYDAYDAYGNLMQKSVSGTGIPTTLTTTDYYPNESAWLVGLAGRVSVTDANGVVLSRRLNLYDDHNAFTAMPSVGKLTGIRTLMSGTQYSQVSMTYDTWGNVTSQTSWTGYGLWNADPTEGAQTRYTCYGSGEAIPGSGKACDNDGYHTYALWTKNAKWHVSSVAYDYALGLPLSETDPNGAVTSAAYDEFGRFTSLSRPGDASPSLTVSYVNNPFKVTLNQVIDASHTYSVARNYDGMGRQTSSVTNGVTVTSTFDAYGRVLTQSMPHASGEAWYYTTTTYDALGRPLTVTAPDGTVTSYAYNGLTTTVTDAKNHNTTSVSNILGWTLSVTPPTGPGVSYEYDLLGNLLTATRGGAIVTLTYDKAGRKTSMDDPDMGDWSYTYDAPGNMLTQTDARGCVTNIAYDVLNRPTGKTYSNCPATPAVTYTYDAGTNSKGRRTSMTDGSGSTTWLYDVRGRMTKETKVISSISFVTEWTYNLADLPERMTYPGGEEVTTHYNNHMQPINVAGTENYVPSMTYDSAGRLLTRALGNGLTQTFNYYVWNQQGGRLHTLVTGSLQNLAYVYDSVGNISQITNSMASETSGYEYDALDRLTSWTLNQEAPETYAYDSAGRLDQKGSMDLQYLNANHVHAVTNANTNTYAYDSNGNQTTRTFGSDHFDLVYDAENRLVEARRNDATIAQFTFDGDGARVKSVMEGETIRFVGGYYEQKGSQITKYYMAGTSRVAMRKYTIPQNMTVEYMLGDHLGSTSITTDSAGAKVSEMRYKPWGEIRYHWIDPDLTTSPTYKLPIYSYTGQRSYMDDPSTTEVEGFGLMDYNARMYDPVLGRFISADSIVAGGMQGYDRYSYVSNAPTGFIDPSGHYRTERSGQESNTGPSDCSTFTLRSINERATMRKAIKSNTVKNAGNAIASIGVQNPWSERGSGFMDARKLCHGMNARTGYFDDCASDPYYTGEGLAKVSDAQMDTPYGLEVAEGHGYGLGLSGLDQTKPEVAVLAMQTRIQIMFDKYLDYCAGNTCNNGTNDFLLAAMAGNGILTDDVKTLYNGFGIKQPDDNGIFDWEGWINNNSNRLDVLQNFVNNWAWLESHGFELPEDIDWNYVCSLLDQ